MSRNLAGKHEVVVLCSDNFLTTLHKHIKPLQLVFVNKLDGNVVVVSDLENSSIFDRGVVGADFPISSLCCICNTF